MHSTLAKIVTRETVNIKTNKNINYMYSAAMIKNKPQRLMTIIS